MPKHQLTKYFLNKWSYFDQNVQYLNKTESLKMKILYSALKDLDPEERRFLADKYRVVKKPFVADAVLAEREGLNFWRYREKRIEIESKLHQSIVKFNDLYKDQLEKAIDFDYGAKKWRETPVKDLSELLNEVFS